MNTTDIKFEGQIKSFPELYEEAAKQFVHYKSIEGQDNWEEYDFSIDCSCDQMMFKDMLQIRFIEELTEASISIPENDEHFWEEIGDSLNFFLSAYIMLGVDFNTLPSPERYLRTNTVKIKPDNSSQFALFAYPVIEGVGYLCNLLKNRPWTQNNFLVSMYDFNQRLEELWIKFWKFLSNLGVNQRDVFEMFYKKYKVNEYRIATGY